MNARKYNSKYVCKICGKPSLFCIWSTSRVFDRVKFLSMNIGKDKIDDDTTERMIKYTSYVVCQKCCHEHDLIRNHF